jgi:hypothetical protein
MLESNKPLVRVLMASGSGVEVMKIPMSLIEN